MSAERPSGGGLHGVESGAQRVLRVQSTFHVADEAQGQAVAAELIDRAHELANSPECECDLDVSVEWVAPEDLTAAPESVRSGGAVAGEHPAAR
ncbi:MAG: hypothetical protein ACRDK7_14500 [Solirubrobacteraceae bacterium]